MGWCAEVAPGPIEAMLRLWAESSFMLSARDTWYLMHSLSSCRMDEPEPDVEIEGSGDTSLGGVGGKVKRCGLEWPADSEEEEAGGYTDRGPGELWCREGLGKGPRFQGGVLWWGPIDLLPSSQGRELCSNDGRQIWVPAGTKDKPAVRTGLGGAVGFLTLRSQEITSERLKSKLCIVNTSVACHNYVCIINYKIKERCIMTCIHIHLKWHAKYFLQHSAAKTKYILITWYVFTSISHISGVSIAATVFYCMKELVQLAQMSKTVKLHGLHYSERLSMALGRVAINSPLQFFTFKRLSIPTSIYWGCTDFESFDMFRDGTIQKRNKVTICPIPLRKSGQ